ncbi:electron transport complex subunit RsxB [Vibrio breoganii]|uniref:Ion-translocating oxidoreductase complex subunit B n=1 Tax=Vibrio breoganii TaxID=553239 RepID=A0AAJ5JNL5_9VIBR|nr:electron transport complex subunit RsxB [Vibrio breoganii]ANO32434.1 electron transport complex subunit RsxB [Vibrio breoganii]MDN3717936.1 electron transport complex subunit RsxB [Vibrio breoganii]NMO73120.1 electron transport complex subunit RsxB [Vibrio breoganii]NMR69407.1 electron transport complex subunit RsxB [Vibrio breoganii]OCH75614.1 electron transport complex subunit RsxB [Vibrio breoganii]
MEVILISIVALVALAALFGGLLGFASIRFKVEADPIVEQVDSILPQTQCGQCGYPGCRPYAEAIANGDAINKCPPGGEATIQKLADLMGVDVPDSAHDLSDNVKKVAFIHEDMCIGCTKCIQACPVDAIVGGTKAMHTIIADQCTGCDLCVSPCPTECIEMIPVKATPDTWKWQLDTIPVVNVDTNVPSTTTENS